jgi:hypothetical protein
MESSYIPNTAPYLRVAKSSFMTYYKCPRQFYWRYCAGLPPFPPTDAMIRGTDIHTVMERGLIGGSEALWEAAGELGYDGDEGVFAMSELLHSIALDLGGLDVVECEVKHEIPEEYNGQNIMWVAIIDGVLRHPDGGLILVELKTGNMNTGKLGRTRKELAFYRRVLSLHPDYKDEEITHFLYITPDYMVPDVYAADKLLNEINKRGKSVWLGAEYGVAIMEPVSTRTVNAFEKSLATTIEKLLTEDYSMKWNDYFCTTWCDFHLSCEEEMLFGDKLFGDENNG